jgi:hypothetical protein
MSFIISVTFLDHYGSTLMCVCVCFRIMVENYEIKKTVEHCKKKDLFGFLLECSTGAQIRIVFFS